MDKGYYERRRRFSDTEKGKAYRKKYNDWYVATKAEILYSYGNIFALDSTMSETITLIKKGKLTGHRI